MEIEEMPLKNFVAKIEAVVEELISALSFILKE
jgi:hypothetical protein